MKWGGGSDIAVESVGQEGEGKETWGEAGKGEEEICMISRDKRRAIVRWIASSSTHGNMSKQTLH